MKKVELLAPAGEREALVAAVQNGADAVYVGGRLFGARAGAANFDGEGLLEAVEYCHKRGVKLYMTVNTLVRDREMPQVYQMVAEAVSAGIDAVIVQDLGVASLLRRCFPDLPLHASTQMSIANFSGAQRAKTLGMRRVVPARECTLQEIADIARAGLDVEAFVHGALCVSYSGQCLLSSMIGGRSGNRGRCAQPCRLPYALGGARGYFLSPADLCSAYDLRDLVRAGATSLKIEGRLKRPEYVAVVTAAYRRALDNALLGKPADPEEMRQLLSIFNRGGFTRGYAMGKNDASVMATSRPNHWGVPVGTVLNVSGGRARVKLTEPLRAGDGLEARGSGGDHGILVERIEGERLRVPEGVRQGDRLYRTTDAAQIERARASCMGERKRTPVDARFTARIGHPCALELGGQRVEGETVQRAEGRPLQAEAVRRQIGKLGDTVLELENFACELEEGAFLPVSALNALRREAAQRCEQAILEAHTPRRTVLPYPDKARATLDAGRPRLVLQSDDVEELLAAGDVADELYFAPRDLAGPALAAALKRLPAEVAVVLPNMLSQEELDEALAALQGRRLVCNNLSQMREGCVADVGLNAFNAGTAARLTELGAARVTASAECTLDEARGLAAACPTELIVRGDVPLMTLRHCPLRAQKGLDERGREHCSLCGGKGARLTDRKGEALRLIPYRAKSGCRVQVFGARTFSALEEMPRILACGFAALRVIGAREDAAACRAAMRGERVRQERGQTTLGHLFKGVE